MIFLRRRFQPGLWSIALTLAGVALFSGLGMWQLERAAFKDAVQQNYQQRLAEDYQRFDADAPLTDLEFRKLRLVGEFDNAHSLLLDNRIYQGKAGYEVLTPLRLAGSDRILLVNRGWIAPGDSRQQLPQILPPAPAASVEGIVSFADAGGYRLGEVRLGDDWPQLIPYIDMPALQQQFSSELLPLVLWMAEEQPGHYQRDWKPVWADPDKSRAYATQWFSFAVIAGILFLILNLRKIE